jgi:hypothetical protein
MSSRWHEIQATDGRPPALRRRPVTHSETSRAEVS